MTNQIPPKKTKIIATIGPASNKLPILKRMMQNGMNIARLNFAHGDFASHAANIQTIRQAAAETGRRIAIFGDLPGPKMRIGKLAQEPITLERGQPFTLTTMDILGNDKIVSMSFEGLPHAVQEGDIIYLNDGFIQLRVEKINWPEVHTYVVMGGELRSHKGINLPGINLGIQAFTDEDHEFLKFAASQQLDAVSLSFVQRAEDVLDVRRAAQALDYDPFIIAKIERANSLEALDEIIEVADALMIARGDLGVEIPLEEVVLVQKNIIQQALVHGKPVITATQMLESMTYNTRPTRAEVSDVTNAILDGTDCLMLSGESAMGIAPDNVIGVMARICAIAEGHRSNQTTLAALQDEQMRGVIHPRDLISFSLYQTIQTLKPTGIIVPTQTGGTARRLCRYRGAPWILAVSQDERVCQQLQFSFGVFAVHVAQYPEDWGGYVRELTARLGDLPHEKVMFVQRLETAYHEPIMRMEMIDFTQPG
jgi:pyruvate kinase